jgi:hypothetical protein
MPSWHCQRHQCVTHFLFAGNIMHCAAAAAAPCFVLSASKPRSRSACRAQAKAAPEWTDKATVAGGGFTGACDIDAVKQVIQECSTLEGQRQKACWASSGASCLACRGCCVLLCATAHAPDCVLRPPSSGCDIEVVTNHYAKAAGLK